MSYTLRGRIDSRLAGALAPAVVAAILALVLHRWWPVEVAGLMVGVGLALDLLLYDRVIEYQPGWWAPGAVGESLSVTSATVVVRPGPEQWQFSGRVRESANAHSGAGVALLSRGG